MRKLQKQIPPSHQPKKDLIENVQNNKNIIQTDKETETIMAFASNLDNEGMKSLWKKYWYTASDIDSIAPEEKDPILYETMKELNQKYGNPKITIKRLGWRNRNDYLWSFYKKTIYINQKDTTDQEKESIIEVRLAELSHSKQFQKGHMTLRMIKDMIMLIKAGWNGRKLYEKKWSIEYEAHKIIQPELINEFIEMYISKIDTTDIQQVIKAKNIFSIYEYNKKQIDTLNKNLQFIIREEKKNKKNETKK
ncbi:MAG: hypothetical protein ACD_80C00086G0002 [uncultured bacterium (gcode 4)]|uniref:Uncharacterized protein n=1 Tax=uncultured bacterium (gcode 4) TaxID=1234023 RepID=K1YIU6_9BACT|nr:MAG: hypothetical protein ACD_80C00086G0002 [uncultured bacterium (gcode 4)]